MIVDELSVKISVDKAKCFDDLAEMNQSVVALIALIPKERIIEAAPHAVTISKLLESWVKTDAT